MRPMGRPRTKNKDLPRGLYKDAAGRFYLKAFTDRDKARLGGKACRAVGTDPTAARLAWAEAFGFRDHDPPAHGTLAALMERFEDEDLPRILTVRGEKRPKYAERTQHEYRRILKKLGKAIGARKFALSELQAAQGGFFRTMDVSAYLRASDEAGRPIQGNRDMAVLGSVFRYAKECGETEYNPCLGASRNLEAARDQEMEDAIFLELYEEASPVLRCLMDLDVMIGARVGDLLQITDFDWSDKGLMIVPGKRKRGQVAKKILFERTDDLAEVIERARKIRHHQLVRDRDKPGAAVVKSQHLFVSGPKGKPYTDSGFQSMMRATKARVARKRLAAAGIASPNLEQFREALKSLDIHFHDGRARAINDAHDAGQNATDFAGHTSDAVTRRVYQRRVVTLRPNPKIKTGS